MAAKKVEKVLKCSGCNKPLVKLWIIEKEEKTKPVKIAAKCCYCDDKSYAVEIADAFFIAGYGLPDPKDEDNEIPVVDIVDQQETNENIVLIITKERK